MIMCPELDLIMRGKSTVVKGAEFLETKDYVQPFVDYMSKITNNFKVDYVMPSQMTISDKNTDITFNRVLVQAVLPDKYCIDNHQEVMGFLYGLDVKKPVAKIYRGYLNKACTNLSVFSPTWITYQEIKPGEQLIYNMQELMESTNNFETTIKRLKDTSFDVSNLEERLGHWVLKSLQMSNEEGLYPVKISESLPIKAFKKLFLDKKSSYYIDYTQGAPSMFQVYNAMTQVITDDSKDIINKFEKTLLVNELLDIQ